MSKIILGLVMLVGQVNAIDFGSKLKHFELTYYYGKIAYKKGKFSLFPMLSLKDCKTGNVKLKLFRNLELGLFSRFQFNESFSLIGQVTKKNQINFLVNVFLGFEYYLGSKNGAEFSIYSTFGGDSIDYKKTEVKFGISAKHGNHNVMFSGRNVQSLLKKAYDNAPTCFSKTAKA